MHRWTVARLGLVAVVLAGCGTVGEPTETNGRVEGQDRFERFTMFNLRSQPASVIDILLHYDGGVPASPLDNIENVGPGASWQEPEDGTADYFDVVRVTFRTGGIDYEILADEGEHLLWVEVDLGGGRPCIKGQVDDGRYLKGKKQ